MVGFFKVITGSFIFQPLCGVLTVVSGLRMIMCLQELNHEYVQVYYAAALSLPDVNFAVTQDDEVISKYGFTHDIILLLKKVFLDFFSVFITIFFGNEAERFFLDEIQKKLYSVFTGLNYWTVLKRTPVCEL